MMPKGYKWGKHSEETKRKISEAHKGKRFSLETRKKLSELRKGINIPHKGKFQKGNIPWNKKGKVREKRKMKRINGKSKNYSHYVYTKYHGLKEIPKGFVIHHIDENPLNDDITNLRLMRAEDHQFLHMMLEKERLKFKTFVQKILERIDEEYDDLYGIVPIEKIKEIIKSEMGRELAEK